MRSFQLVLLYLLPFTIHAQVDSTYQNVLQLKGDNEALSETMLEIALEIDSLNKVNNELRSQQEGKFSGVEPFKGSYGRDKAAFLVKDPTLFYGRDGEVPFAIATHEGVVISNAVEIDAYLTEYFNDTFMADLHVKLCDTSASLRYSGFWQPSGFISNVIEYENGVPVREWEKVYGEFKLKE